jgi:hypothetical protein
MLNKVMLVAAEQIGKQRKVVETPLFYVIQSLSYILIKEIPILLYFVCSPLKGPLKVNGNETFVFHNDSVIIWSKQNRNLEKECKIN